MMKVAQRMVTSFYVSISASASHRWTTLSALNEIGVRVTLRKITEHGQPSGVVLCAATSIWLPLPRQLFSISSKMKGKDHRYCCEIQQMNMWSLLLKNCRDDCLI